jgi:hypothetical protein
MPKRKKLTIRTAARPAIVIFRPALSAKRLVYVAVANKRLKYPHGRSCIAYIGTTKAGARRIAASAAVRAPGLLSLHGVTALSFFVVTCRARQNVESWKKLETGLIVAFKHLYGEVPKCNVHGKNRRWGDVLNYFTRSRLEAVLEKYESARPP